jgi:hypothetical protein
MKFAETTQEVSVTRANNIGYQFRVPLTHNLPQYISSIAAEFGSTDKIGPSLPSFEVS